LQIVDKTTKLSTKLEYFLRNEKIFSFIDKRNINKTNKIKQKPTTMAVIITNRLGN